MHTFAYQRRARETEFRFRSSGGITEYADRNGIAVARWFVEKGSAAKRNRPAFADVLKRLRCGEAQGVVMHKIDRSARNLRDWADLGELIDSGVEAHFVADALDLQTRGGRLSADIQAVVAADYIKNLREETKKGFYGRLRQGLYPLPAPLGYRDGGPGKPKEIDPVMGPLVRRLFSLYGTGGYSLDSLQAEAKRFGLRNRAGGIVTKNDLSLVLNNPFYRGLIKIRKTGETFDGVHEPLVDAVLWRRVQDVLRGRTKRGAGSMITSSVGFSPAASANGTQSVNGRRATRITAATAKRAR